MGGPHYDPVFEFWLPGVLLNCVGLLGLLGNTMSIFVLSRSAQFSAHRAGKLKKASGKNAMKVGTFPQVLVRTLTAVCFDIKFLVFLFNTLTKISVD
jgi:hypothetical protein